MPETKVVTLEQFLAAFAGKGTKFAAMLTVTRPKLNKSNRETGETCPYPAGVECRKLRNVQLGCLYENSVNNQREREGNSDEFTSQGLWVSKEFPDGAGERDSTYTVRHRKTGERYFAVKPASDAETGVVLPAKAETWIDLATGKPIDPETLKPYLPKPSSQPKTQETDKAIAWRTISVNSVVQIQCGETFVLQPSFAK